VIKVLKFEFLSLAFSCLSVFASVNLLSIHPGIESTIFKEDVMDRYNHGHRLPISLEDLIGLDQVTAHLLICNLSKSLSIFLKSLDLFELLALRAL